MLRKKLLILLCFLFFLFVGIFYLNAASDPDMSKVLSYAEQEIGKEAGLKQPVSRMRMNSKKELIVCDMEHKPVRYVYINTEGKPVREISAGFEASGALFTLDWTDKLWVLVQNPVKDQKTGVVKEILLQLWSYDERNRTWKKILLKKIPGGVKTPIILDFAVDSKGNVFLQRYGEKTVMIDARSKKEKNIGPAVVTALLVDPEDRLLLASFNGGKGSLMKIDPVNGSVVWEADTGDIPANILFYHEVYQTIYLMNSRGIQWCTANGRVLGYVFDARPYHISEADLYTSSLAVDPDKNFYFCLSRLSTQSSRGDNWWIYRYKPQGKKADRRTALLLGGLQHRISEVAAKEFEKENTEWKIDLKGCFQGFSEEYQSDLKRLNTELMAGKGADVLIFSSYMTYRKYLEKGVLADLNQFIAKDKEFKWSEYYDNLINGCRFGGKLYLIPVGVYFNTTLTCRSALAEANLKIDDTLWTWDDFFDLAEKVTCDLDHDGKPDRYAMPKLNDEFLHQLFAYYFGPKFINYEQKKTTFDSPGFIASLKKLHNFERFQNSRYESDNTWTNEKHAFFISGLVKGEIVFYNWSLLDNHSFSEFYDTNIAFLFPPRSQEKTPELVYNSLMLCGINQNSKNKEAAWEFIKTLLSEPVQASFYCPGFSVNREGQRIRNEWTNATWGTSDWYQKSNIRRFETNFADIKRFCEAGTKLYMVEFELLAIFQQEVKKFLAGEKSAEEAAKVIQSKVSMYLNE